MGEDGAKVPEIEILQTPAQERFSCKSSICTRHPEEAGEIELP